MSAKRACLVVLTVLGVAIGAMAQSGSMVRGKVRTTNGGVVNGAIVELRMAGGAGVAGQTVTRGDGDFEFTGLQPGEYELAVAMAGYDPAIQLVRFNQSMHGKFQEVLNVEITLKPTPDPLLSSPGTMFAQDVPKAAKAAYEKGIVKLSEGKLEEGLTLLREAIGSFEDYFAAHYRLGVELYRAGKMDQALESLERARQINDRDSGVYNVFGLVMLKQQKFAVAEYAFGEAIRLGPNSPQAHFHRALALIDLASRRDPLSGANDGDQRTGRFTEAEKELKQALDLSSKKLVGAYLALARIHEALGDKQAMIQDLENYLKADPTSKQATAVREALSKLRGVKD